MMNTTKHFLYLSFSLFFLFSCAPPPESVGPSSDLVGISKQQFVSEGMQLGSMDTMVFEQNLPCQGSLVPLPSGMARVNALYAGVVKAIHCHAGQIVSKNQVLMEIAGSEMIDLQREFAESSASLQRLKSEFSRVQALYTEKIATEKEFIMAESEYKGLLARYKGLKMKIKTLGLEPDKIEQGDFYPSYVIRAPIQGQISSLRATLGSYVDSNSELIEIMDPDKFQVQLSVFASDVASLQKGQLVRFKSVNSDKVHLATLSSIGVVIDQESKSIKCHAKITPDGSFRPVGYEFIESEIVTSADTVLAIPESALVKTETGHSILVLKTEEKDQYLFEEVEVKIGRQWKGFSEISGKRIEGLIVVKGVYNMML